MKLPVGRITQRWFIVPKARFRRDSWVGFQHALDPLGDPRPLRNAGTASVSSGEPSTEPDPLGVATRDARAAR